MDIHVVPREATALPRQVQDHPDTPEIREIRIWICLPFWPDKVMRDLHLCEWQQSSISAFLRLSLMDTETYYLTFKAASECLLSMPLAQCWNNITSLTLSSAKQWWLCPTIKGSKSEETLFKSVSCKIFEQSLFTSRTECNAYLWCWPYSPQCEWRRGWTGPKSWSWWPCCPFPSAGMASH
jgi:hypothetical protein